MNPAIVEFSTQWNPSIRTPLKS